MIFYVRDVKADNNFKISPFPFRPAWIQALGKDLEIKLGQGILTLLTINNLMNPMVYLIFNRYSRTPLNRPSAPLPP